MDLNDLQLPAALVAEMYKDTLVEDGKDKKESVPAPAPPLKSSVSFSLLGGNEKQVLILVDQQQAAFLPDTELDFLVRILGACKLGLADVAILNLHAYPDATFKEIAVQIPSRIVLLFDTEPARLSLPINFPQYQIQPFSGNSFLYSASLERLMNDAVEKSKLWVCLKRMFNL
jgi:hypothetical protein